ncbi:MAG: cytochrome c maturation protein CcmE [Proteobacteria bacterium]|nr:cytochrome c maturation protein CcmE [Pseudomonadota bacterium]
MHPRRYKWKRAFIIVLAIASISAGFAGFSVVFRDNLVFFFSPSELLAKMPSPTTRVRVGGLVEKGSLQEKSGSYHFIVTDGANSIPVTYTGLIPNLFREGQGVVAEGSYDGKIFIAKTIMAKHDEKYMPPEVSDAIKKSGHWKSNYKQ